MANERKTENIVRAHFEQFNELIHVEEQSSDNAKINKLLQSASKKGTGKGRPEFIISLNYNSDLLIVVECKASTLKHDSQTRDKYSEFAVDGALLYASYLSKEFDVLAIAVSGETKQILKVSHFLHLKNERAATEIFGDTLLSIPDYLNGYLKSPEKFRQDYNVLLEFTKKLNEKLHTHKILESQRSLLLSCILIALEDEAFKSSYSKKNTPKSLAEFLTKTVSEKLEEANISGKKLENLNIQFGFIKTDTSLSTKDKILKELIDEIDQNINQFIKTHEYFDVLGQLYIEFLRYANSDKGLGIVLTPPHITELFAELAQVNRNSIAFDNCTGTGGFLISAMKKMIEDAKGDNTKIAEIKSKQLIGVEYQAHIFALAVSNMYIHQDGKTNIMNGSCFDESIMREVKLKRPTVGFLNPPYKADKKNDKEELEFILNNLDALVDGGTCIAIVPMGCAIATKGKIKSLKEELLNKHTLEAVLSMPDELFFNSDVGVVSCIMVFTAHKPHQKDVETYFGYYKQDGFEKKKGRGRIDANGDWEKIKYKWINYYKRKKEEAGLSINKIVTADMEWCAESYMETDYKALTHKNFERKLLEYSTFLFYNNQRPTVSNKPYQEDSSIYIDVQNWLYFDVLELFEIMSTRDELPNKLAKGVLTPYITSTELNNGISLYVDEESTFGANTITANRGGSVGFFFYQPINFMATPVDVRVLKPRFQMNQYNALFLATVLELERYRFNYSRKMGTDRLKNMKIKLPSIKINDIQKPDFQFMEDYIKSLAYSCAI
jgi:methylase of polypeptide subunit release factors